MNIVDLDGNTVSTPDLTFVPFDIMVQFVQWAEDFEFENNPPFVGSLKNSVDNLKEESKESMAAFNSLLCGPSGLTNKDFISQPERVDKLIDGFADTAFVAINGIYKCFRILGSQPTQALAGTVAALLTLAVANNSKRFPDGTVKKNEVGKVIKPDNFIPPSYLPLINASIEMNHDNVSAENRELSTGSSNQS